MMRFNFRGPNGELYTEVFVDDKKNVKFKNHTDFWADCAFGKRTTATYGDVLTFFEMRTFPRNREDLPEILEAMGLKEYDPYKMCIFSEGRCASDDDWIEFLEG